MKRFLIVLMVLVIAISFTACGKSGSIIGEWTFGATSIAFREDNSVSISINKTLDYDGTYTVDGDKITVTAKGLVGEVSEEFTYSLNKGVLSLTGDITLMGAADVTMDFIKQEGSAETTEKKGFLSGLFSFLSPNKAKDETATEEKPAEDAATEDTTVEDKKEEKGFFSKLFSFLTPGKKEETAAHVHEFSESTCTEPAKCVCGEIKEEAPGHTYVEGICSVCGEKDPEFDKSIREGYVKLNHVRVRSGPGTHASVVQHNKAEIQLNTWHPVKVHGGKILSDDPKYPNWYNISFTYNGIAYDGYMFCDYINIPAADEEDHEHVYSSYVSKEATCISEGERKYSCSSCGQEYIENISKNTEHEWESATCTSPSTCYECGKTEGSARGHSYYDGICFKCGAAQP